MKIPTYCINLERRSDRKQMMLEQIYKFENVLDFNIIKAIDHLELETVSEKWLYSKPKYACLLSHIKALELFIESGSDIGLIMEDDVIFCQDFEKRMNLYLEILPEDWDLAYLGYTPIHGDKSFDVSKNLIKIEKCQGAWAYMVNKKFANRLLDEFNSLYNYSDVILADIQESCNAYCFMPFFGYVRAIYSDLDEKIVYYFQIKEKFNNRIR